MNATVFNDWTRGIPRTGLNFECTSVRQVDSSVLNIVLYQPEIPQNTGAIARTCAMLTARLHLIRPFGFQIGDKRVRRASMDYLEDAELIEHASFEAFEASLTPESQVWTLSDKGSQNYTQVEYGKDDYLVFGRESDGMPDEILFKYPCIHIPMPGSEKGPREDHRFHSLNLSVCVGIVGFEAARQVTQNWTANLE
jgi:tRNA (cytidine/uridine-2'-O-)-methyltransferase